MKKNREKKISKVWEIIFFSTSSVINELIINLHVQHFINIYHEINLNVNYTNYRSTKCKFKYALIIYHIAKYSYQP